MNNGLTMDTLAYLEEKGITLLERFKKCLKANQEIITTSLILISGDFFAYNALRNS